MGRHVVTGDGRTSFGRDFPLDAYRFRPCGRFVYDRGRTTTPVGRQSRIRTGLISFLEWHRRNTGLELARKVPTVSRPFRLGVSIIRIIPTACFGRPTIFTPFTSSILKTNRYITSRTRVIPFNKIIFPSSRTRASYILGRYERIGSKRAF